MVRKPRRKGLAEGGAGNLTAIRPPVKSADKRGDLMTSRIAVFLAVSLFLLAALSGCGPSYARENQDPPPAVHGKKKTAKREPARKKPSAHHPGKKQKRAKKKKKKSKAKPKSKSKKKKSPKKSKSKKNQKKKLKTKSKHHSPSTAHAVRVAPPVPARPSYTTAPAVAPAPDRAHLVDIREHPDEVHLNFDDTNPEGE